MNMEKGRDMVQPAPISVGQWNSDVRCNLKKIGENSQSLNKLLEAACKECNKERKMKVRPGKKIIVIALSQKM